MHCVSFCLVTMLCGSDRLMGRGCCLWDSPVELRGSVGSTYGFAMSGDGVGGSFAQSVLINERTGQLHAM